MGIADRGMFHQSPHGLDYLLVADRVSKRLGISVSHEVGVRAPGAAQYVSCMEERLRLLENVVEMVRNQRKVFRQREELHLVKKLFAGSACIALPNASNG